MTETSFFLPSSNMPYMISAAPRSSCQLGRSALSTGPGKLKTIAQTVATAALLFHYETLGLPAYEIGLTLLAIATVLTLWSGYLYFSDYFGWNRPAAS